jgi:hypothetical protein
MALHKVFTHLREVGLDHAHWLVWMRRAPWIPLIQQARRKALIRAR